VATEPLADFTEPHTLTHAEPNTVSHGYSAVRRAAPAPRSTAPRLILLLRLAAGWVGPGFSLGTNAVLE
jgi:hypothetical protein